MHRPASIQGPRRLHKRALNGLEPPDRASDEDDTTNDTGDTPQANDNPTPTRSATSSQAASSTSRPVSRAAAPTTSSTPPAPRPTTTSSSQPAATSAAPVTTSTPQATVIQATTQVVASVASLPTTASVPLTRIVATPTLPRVSSASASPSETAAAESSGPAIGTLVGVVAGGLIGVVVLAAMAGYFFRRAFRKKDEFDRGEFVRNSEAIPDSDWREKPSAATRGMNDGPSVTPRPPSILERRGQAGSYQVGEVMNPPATDYYSQQDQSYYNYGPNNGYNNYGQDQYGAGYNDQYATGDQYAAATGYGYTPPSQHQQSELTRKPSAPLGSVRGPGSEYQQNHHGPEHQAEYSQYDSRHQSVTPFQQQQYNEINRHLNVGSQASGADGRSLTPGAGTGHAQPGVHNRRSVYEEEDAYGGI